MLQRNFIYLIKQEQINKCPISCSIFFGESNVELVDIYVYFWCWLCNLYNPCACKYQHQAPITLGSCCRIQGGKRVISGKPEWLELGQNGLFMITTTGTTKLLYTTEQSRHVLVLHCILEFPIHSSWSKAFREVKDFH